MKLELKAKPEKTGNGYSLDEIYAHYSFGGTRLSLIRINVKSKVRKLSVEIAMNSYRILKRCMDILLSMILLFALFPIFIITALIIRLESSGPVIYIQIRVGKWGRLFRMYKFRSMEMGADQKKKDLLNANEMDGVVFKIKNDPRVTGVGRVIRKTSIDELPQLWNVLKGEMSLVGPRPPLPSEVSKYALHDRKRLDVIPGITCIWQVNGRNNINFEGQVKLDIQYIENQKFWGDIYLLLKTIPAVLFRKGAS